MMIMEEKKIVRRGMNMGPVTNFMFYYRKYYVIVNEDLSKKEHGIKEYEICVYKKNKRGDGMELLDPVYTKNGYIGNAANVKYIKRDLVEWVRKYERGEFAEA